MIKFFLLVSLISSSTIGLKTGGFTFKIPDENGHEITYIKGVGDQEGMAASYQVLSHPNPKENQRVIVTVATDGSEILVKNIYGADGRELLDCDVRMNETEIEKFVDEIETKAQNILTVQGLTGSTELLETSPAISDLKMNIADQLARCENFLQRIVRQESESGLESVEIEGEQKDENKRKKRSYLIWPGTNWCGKGSKAEFAQSYGENVEADQCCQKHDQCPYIIQGFTTRYNLFNYRMHTLSVCECDDKFMTCLKSANTSTATMVGKVYFNVVNTECFDLKLQKTCSKRSWWGGCEKYATKWVATVRSLGNYPENM